MLYRVTVMTHVTVDAKNMKAAKAVAETEVRGALNQYGPTPGNSFANPGIYGPFAVQAVGKVFKVETAADNE
jgi:hypothetical protein